MNMEKRLEKYNFLRLTDTLDQCLLQWEKKSKISDRNETIGILAVGKVLDETNRTVIVEQIDLKMSHISKYD